MKKSLPFTFYLLYYAAASFTFPFIILYLQGLKFSGPQIGLVAGLIPLVSLLGVTFWTRLADLQHRHNRVMSLTILGAIFLSITFPFLKAFILVLIVSVLFAFFTSPINSLADSATMTMLASEKALYGRVRLGGTIGWGLMAPVAGFLIQSFGIQWAFWGYALIMVLAFIISQKFSFPLRTKNNSIKGDFRQTFANRRWLFFLILAFVAGVGFASMTNYLFPYMEELGISRLMMTVALTIASIGELPILFFTNRLLKRFGAFGLLGLAMAVTGVRLLLYAGLNFTAGILLFQLLNGMTLPLFWAAGVSYADENSPTEMKATAQGLMGTMIFGFGAAAGGLVGGLMLGSIGGRWMYLIFGCVELVSLGIIFLLARANRLPQAKGVS
jgi:PPP family 3-phenylpropionic acid transporter